MTSVGLSSNFSLISFSYVPIMALCSELEIATAAPSLILPNYSCLREERVFVSQRTEIQYDGMAVVHVTWPPSPNLCGGGGRLGMQWLAQSRSHATNLGLVGSEVGGENQPCQNHVDPLIQTKGGVRNWEVTSGEATCTVITFLALASFPSDPSQVSGMKPDEYHF